MHKQPTVLMIGWEYPPHNSGGLGVACEGLTKALSAQNTQIFFTLPYPVSGGLNHMKLVQCFDPDWTSGDVLVDGQFSAYGNTSSIIPSPTADLIDSSQLRTLPQSELDARVNQYAELVAKRARPLHKKIDLIHAHDWMSLPAAQKVSAHSHKPYVAHVHSTEFDRVPNGCGSQFIHSVEYQGLQKADHIITVSYYTKHLLVTQYGLSPKKISVVHNGIDPLDCPPDTSRHHFASQRPVIVFMGRLTSQKGGEYFLRLAKRVVQSIPNALFVVAGSGDLYHQLLFQTAFDHLSAHVLFSGFVRDRQRELLLNRADLFVMPSVSEPFGLVALEAAQRHTPVIVSKQSGVVEVLPSAVQLDFWDIDAMVKEMIDLLQNKDRHQQAIDRQLRDISKVTWSKSASRVRDIYQRLFQ